MIIKALLNKIGKQFNITTQEPKNSKLLIVGVNNNSSMEELKSDLCERNNFKIMKFMSYIYT